MVLGNTQEADEIPPVGWLPVRWAWNGGSPVVDWVDFGDQRLKAPFFAQSVQDAQGRSPAVRRTGAGALAALPDTGPTARPAGLIFHLSRCGSTLAAQALAALPGHIVLSEPETLDEVLRAGTLSPDVPPSAQVAALRGLAGAYGRPRAPGEERLFIKLDAWHILHFPRLRTAFPGVPWVFLYRDPVEVLVSQLTEVSGRMLPSPELAAELGLPLGEVLGLPQEELCARALGRIAAAGADAATLEPELGRVINYAELPAALETVLVPWFGLPWQASDREQVARVTGFHAKSPGRPFAADGPAKQRLISEELRALVERWAGPAYARLEVLRAARPVAKTGDQWQVPAPV